MDPLTRLLAQGAAGAAGTAATYVEDVFSTWLYTGNSSTQTITNGIDLSGKGGLVWIKVRSGDLSTSSHQLYDTARGIGKVLFTNATNAEVTRSDGVTAFNGNGFSLGANVTSNGTLNNYASWTFREAAKFFDVVTYTGNGTLLTINHNLGSVPGCIVVKRTDSTSNWPVYHRSLSTDATVYLNGTTGAVTRIEEFGSVTSTTFQVGDSGGGSAQTNASGGTYVAYLFAHDAGGFGDSGNDSVVSCGSYTGNGSTTGPVINLGWEPQWVIVKNASSTGSWGIHDTMRGFAIGSGQELYANASSAEGGTSIIEPTSTGFLLTNTNSNYNASGNTYIYIAIRRGLMKAPTDATKVFGLNARTGTGVDATVTGGQVDDAVLIKNRGSAVGDLFAARLTGTRYLETSSTAAEIAAGITILQANPWDLMDGVKVGTTSTITNASANTFINYLFRRAPGFFDVVAYTGTGVARTVNHNLGVAPELMIVKGRDAVSVWAVYYGNPTQRLFLNFTNATAADSTFWNDTAPTSTVFTVGTGTPTNSNGAAFIAYLFASCPGVSKVGSYTGTGTTLSIDCGFTAGARFVLIKRTDSTGDWYVWDTARGIIAANDPYILLNSTAAEVTNTDFIDPLSSGFQISSTAPAAINASGGSFIFFAVA